MSLDLKRIISIVIIIGFIGVPCPSFLGNTGSEPAATFVMDDSLMTGRYNSIVIDRDDVVHIAYSDNANNSVRYLKGNKDGWELSNVEVCQRQDNFRVITLKLDHSKYPHVCYIQDYGFHGLMKYARWDGSKWHIETPQYETLFASMALDSLNRPHMVYENYMNSSLYYLYWTGSQWVYQKIVSDYTDDADSPSLALDTNDVPHIAYFSDTDNSLKYATVVDSHWEFSLVDESQYGRNVGEYPSIALDSNDVPHMSYYDRRTGSLKYAFWNGVIWETRTIDDEGDVGICTSLALDSNDLPHISYMDADNECLKYATKENTKWICYTIDNSSRTGYFNSIALDSTDQAHVAYYDLSNYALKYACPAMEPYRVEVFNATAGDRQIFLQWVAPYDGGRNITNYKLYRGESSGSMTYHKTVGAVLHYLDTDVVNGRTYYYRIGPVNTVGEGELSHEVSARPEGVPTRPLDLKATAYDMSVGLTWDVPANDGGEPIEHYMIYRHSELGEYLNFSTGNTGLSYMDKGIMNGITYTYRLSAVNELGESELSDGVSARPQGPPAAPRNLVTDAGDQEIELTWEPPPGSTDVPILYYKIYSRTEKNVEMSFSTKDDTTSFTDSGLTNGLMYYYRVSAVNEMGEGTKTDEVGAKPLGVPTRPRDFTATGGDGEIILSWKPPQDNGGDDIIQYRLFRRADTGIDITFYLDGSECKYTDNDVVNGVAYYYQISALNGKFESGKTDEIEIIPVGLPSAPTIISVLETGGKIVVNWKPPEDDGGSQITGYSIYRYELAGQEKYLADIGNILYFVDYGLKNEHTYYYAVKAVNIKGEGPLSNEVIVRTHSIKDVPTAPTNVLAEGGEEEIVVKWDLPYSDGGDEIIGYAVYKQSDSDNTEIKINVTSGRMYKDVDVEVGETYYYRVTAVNSIGEGPRSEMVVAKPRKKVDASSDDKMVIYGAIAGVLVALIAGLILIFLFFKKKEKKGVPKRPHGYQQLPVVPPHLQQPPAPRPPLPVQPPPPFTPNVPQQPMPQPYPVPPQGTRVPGVPQPPQPGRAHDVVKWKQ